MRTFIVLARHGRTSPDFSVDDLPGAGKLDLVCRTVSNALWVSSGIRYDTVVHVAMNGPKDPPKLITFSGADLENFGCDERSVGLCIRRALAKGQKLSLNESRDVRDGIRVAKIAFETLIKEKERKSKLIYLHPEGRDVRTCDLRDDFTFVLGGVQGLPKNTERLLDRLDAMKVSLGPTVLFASHCPVILHNELDRCMLETTIHLLTDRPVECEHSPMPLRKVEVKRLFRAAARKYPPQVDIAFLLQSLDDPLNVGALFRVADACGARELILAGRTPSPPHEGIDRAARGHQRRVPWRRIAQVEEAIAILKEEGYHVLALEPARGAQCYVEYPYPPKVCLVLGNESKGIYASTLTHCDGAVFIPMYGKGASLNVHVAGALAAYQALIGRTSRTEDEWAHRNVGPGSNALARSLLED